MSDHGDQWPEQEFVLEWWEKHIDELINNLTGHRIEISNRLHKVEAAMEKIIKLAAPMAAGRPVADPDRLLQHIWAEAVGSLSAAQANEILTKHHSENMSKFGHTMSKDWAFCPDLVEPKDLEDPRPEPAQRHVDEPNQDIDYEWELLISRMVKSICEGGPELFFKMGGAELVTPFGTLSIMPHSLFREAKNEEE